MEWNLKGLPNAFLMRCKGIMWKESLYNILTHEHWRLTTFEYLGMLTFLRPLSLYSSHNVSCPIFGFDFCLLIYFFFEYLISFEIIWFGIILISDWNTMIKILKMAILPSSVKFLTLKLKHTLDAWNSTYKVCFFFYFLVVGKTSAKNFHKIGS